VVASVGLRRQREAAAAAPARRRALRQREAGAAAPARQREAAAAALARRLALRPREVAAVWPVRRRAPVAGLVRQQEVVAAELEAHLAVGVPAGPCALGVALGKNPLQYREATAAVAARWQAVAAAKEGPRRR